MLYAAVDISRCGCASHQPACLLLPVNTPIDAAHAHIDSSRQDADTCCAFDALGFLQSGHVPTQCSSCTVVLYIVHSTLCMTIFALAPTPKGVPAVLLVWSMPVECSWQSCCCCCMYEHAYLLQLATCVILHKAVAGTAFDAPLELHGKVRDWFDMF
jgi:hypothetical protein